MKSGRALKNTPKDAKKKTRRAYNFKPKTSLLKMYNGQNMESGPFEDGNIECESANNYNDGNDDSEAVGQDSG